MEPTELLPPRKLDFFLDFTPPTATSQQKGERVIVPKKGGRPFVHHFKKKNVQDAEAELWAMLHPYRPSTPFLGPVRLQMLWTWPFRSSDTKKAIAAGWLWRDTQPDADNLVKMAQDQMSKLGFWTNDGQIADLRVLKKFGTTPGIRIIVEQLTNP